MRQTPQSPKDGTDDRLLHDGSIMRVHPQTRAVVAALLTTTLGCAEPASQPSATGQPPASATQQTCTSTLWGTAEYDQLYALEDASGKPLLFCLQLEHESTSALAELATRLKRAVERDPTALAPAVRVALQNDAWGLAQRARGVPASHTELERVHTQAQRLVDRLALPTTVLTSLKANATRQVLPPSRGWQELGTEHSVFQHETSFGLRRLFRVFGAGEQFALSSELVAIDTQGRAVLTTVPGEIEMLTLSEQGATAARVFELDRHALRCFGIDAALVEVAEVSQVPGLGANRLVAEFDPPEPLAQLPCLRCHHDRDLMSLPSHSEDIGQRHRELLTQATQERH